MESGIVYLLKIFRACDEAYGDHEKNKCNAAFGMVPPKVMRRANEHVQMLKYLVGKRFSPIVLQVVGKSEGSSKGKSSRKQQSPESENGSEEVTLFGQGLQLAHPRLDVCLSYESHLPKEWKQKLQREAAQDGGGFSMKYGGGTVSGESPSVIASTSAADARDDADNTMETVRDKVPLEAVIEELTAKFGDASDEIIQSLFSGLVSDRTNESLQNDVSLL